MLVPAMQSIGTCSSSSTLSTPTWAPPFAPPPASTRPTRGRCGAVAAGAADAATAVAIGAAVPNRQVATTRTIRRPESLHRIAGSLYYRWSIAAASAAVIRQTGRMSMTSIFEFLHGQPFFVIFGVVALGMWLGRKKVGGISLGSVVCIILVGLITSTWAFRASGVSLALPDVLKTVFFNLFIFAIGVKIGPQFFSGLERDGWHLVLIGAIVAVLAPLLAWGFGWFFDWPRGTVAG